MIWITRPFEQSQNAIECCKKHQLKAYCHPLLLINPTIIEQDSAFKTKINQADGLAVTSMNAIRHLKNLNDIDFNKPLLCPGLKSAMFAQMSGFKNVYHDHRQGIVGIPPLIENLELKNILYCHGMHTKHDFQQYVQHYFTNHISIPIPHIETICLYEAIPIQSLPYDIISLIKSQKIKAITCFSERSIDTLLNLCQQHHILENLDNITLLCMSEPIAHIAKQSHMTKIIIADSLEEMLSQLLYHSSNTHTFNS